MLCTDGDVLHGLGLPDAVRQIRSHRSQDAFTPALCVSGSWIQIITGVLIPGVNGVKICLMTHAQVPTFSYIYTFFSIAKMHLSKP